MAGQYLFLSDWRDKQEVRRVWLFCLSPTQIGETGFEHQQRLELKREVTGEALDINLTRCPTYNLPQTTKTLSQSGRAGSSGRTGLSSNSWAAEADKSP